MHFFYKYIFWTKFKLICQFFIRCLYFFENYALYFCKYTFWIKFKLICCLLFQSSKDRLFAHKWKSRALKSQCGLDEENISLKILPCWILEKGKNLLWWNKFERKDSLIKVLSLEGQIFSHKYKMWNWKPEVVTKKNFLSVCRVFISCDYTCCQ